MKLLSMLLLAMLLARGFGGAERRFHLPFDRAVLESRGRRESNAARVEFREEGGADAWRQGLDLWFDARNGEYRGSLVELEPGTAYEVKLTLSAGCDRNHTRPEPGARNFAIQQDRPGRGRSEAPGDRPEDSGDAKRATCSSPRRAGGT